MLKPQQVSIETGVLKDKLTTAYANLRQSGQSMMSVKHFEDLWDIKERALLEKQASVIVPSGWLSHLDEVSTKTEKAH
jgi:hypothetical protein